MSDLIPWSNLLPQYNSPNQLAQQNASIQNTQASTGLIGEQTQAADIANQGASLSLGALKQAYANGVPGVNAPSNGGAQDSIGGTGVAPDDVVQHAVQQFAPVPTKPPPALQQQAYLLSLGGRPEAARALLDNYAMQVGGVNQQKQLGASQAYQTADTVANAPPGAAFAVLNRYNPQAAEAIKKQYADATPEELDKDVREYAGHVAVATHQYSARETDMQNGVLIDKPTGKAIPGQSQVLTGLDAGGKQKAFDEANSMVTEGDSLPMPKWKASGFPSAEAYVLNADRAARSSANAPPPGGPPATPSQIPPASSSQPPQPTRQATPPPQAASAPKAAPAPSPAVTDPVLKQALADPGYKIQPLPKPQTQEDLKSNNDLIAARNASRTELLKDAADQTSSASQALMYTKAAQQIMSTNGNVAGLAAENRATLDKVLQAAGWTQGVNATNYQELVKYLTNAGIQAGKGNFGKGMTEKENELQLHEASPDATKTPEAINNLLAANAKNLQYTLDSAKRVGFYTMDPQNDPQRFAEWNDAHFNRSAAVNTVAAGGAQEGAVSTSKSGKPIVFTNGHWQYK